MTNDIIEIQGKAVKESEDKPFMKLELIKYWDKDYINQRIDMIKNLKHQVLTRFLWMSGVRVTEAVSVRKQDIDFTNYVMQVRWLKSRKYKYRIVPLHHKLRDMLQIYTTPLKAEDRLFNITRQMAWQVTTKHLKGSPHRLRHSFAINWLRSGGDIVTLHKMLGHSKIQTTMEYLKIVPADQGKELNKVSFE
jgi:integrase